MLTVSSRTNRSSANRPAARPLSRERVFCCFAPPIRRALSAIAPVLMALLALILVVSPAAAWQQATPVVNEAALESATLWLLSQQAEDGGFVGFSGETDTGTTVDALLALASARRAGIDVDLQPALDFLLSGDHALVYAQSGAGQAAKLVLAVVAAGGNPRDVNGVDPLSLAMAGRNPDTKLWGNGAFDHALVMLAMAAAGEKIPNEMLSRLVDAQQKDGSWAFDGSELAGTGDTNTTAIAIQAMAAAGKSTGRDVRQALEFLRSAQLPDGGFQYQPTDGSPADANSTGIVVQALIAAGQDPSSADWHNALGALVAFQNPSGAFRYMNEPPDDNLFATLQAIPALAGVPFSALVAPEAATPAAA